MEHRWWCASPPPSCRKAYLIVVNVIQPRVTFGDYESRRVGWFTRRSSTLHRSWPPLATIVPTGLEHHGLVGSLLDLPRLRSSSVYSSRHPSPPHRTAIIISIFFSGGSLQQMTLLAPCWISEVTSTSSPCRDCQGPSPPSLPYCSAAGNSWLLPTAGVVARPQPLSLAAIMHLLGFGSNPSTLSNRS